jgi:alanine racemase
VIYRISLARVLSEHAQNRGISWPVHIKVDTGMGRLGLRPEEVEGFFMGLRLLKGLEIEGILTHFADADISDKRFAQEQMAIFLRICDALDKNGGHVPIRHVANSAAVVDLPETHLDMVRSGLMLYGYHPSRTDLPLQKILSWKTRVVHLKKVPTGTTISYGRTFVTRRESLIATLPVGYADGFDRTLTNRGVVLIRGMRAPVVGRVCMDMTMLDVTEVPGVAVGDTVTLLGRDGSEEITAHDLANQAGTICYEILSRIGPRVQRTYQ